MQTSCVNCRKTREKLPCQLSRKRQRHGDCSDNLNGRTHGHLNVDGLDVLPLLLQQRSKEVESHDNVLSELLVGHLLVTDGDVEAGDLLELPLDGSSNISNLLGERLVVGNGLREETDSVKMVTADLVDLGDDGVSGEEELVLLGPLGDSLLLLVELGEGIKVGDIDVETGGSDLISVLLIGNDADLKLGTRDVGKSDGTGETLVLLGIVILETDLELDSLRELTSLGVLPHISDIGKNLRVGDLGGHENKVI